MLGGLGQKAPLVFEINYAPAVELIVMQRERPAVPTMAEFLLTEPQVPHLLRAPELPRPLHPPRWTPGTSGRSASPS